MSAGELIFYRSDDGRAEVHLRAEGDTVWLTQAEMAELFDTTLQAMTPMRQGSCRLIISEDNHAPLLAGT